jgi:hypothetical protein
LSLGEAAFVVVVVVVVALLLALSEVADSVFLGRVTRLFLAFGQALRPLVVLLVFDEADGHHCSHIPLAGGRRRKPRS